MPRSEPDTNAGFAAALASDAKGPPDAVGARQTRRFAIYRNNVAHGVIEALAASFPAVQALVGEEFFAGAALAYHADEPPCSPLLFEYGGGFAGHLDGFAPAASVPYLGDVARLEWARLQAHHAGDAAPVTIAELGAIAPSALADTRLVLHPSAAILTSSWPIYALWAASTGVGEAQDVDLARAEAVLIHRPEFDVEIRHLAPGSATFLAALSRGESLGSAADAAQTADPAFDLSSELTGVFAIGAIVGISPPAD